MNNVKRNAIYFKLFWYKVFVHQNFLADSVLKCWGKQHILPSLLPPSPSHSFLLQGGRMGGGEGGGKVVGWVLSKIRKSCFDGNFLRKIYASLICFVGSLQLLTQGSADVVLEACTDYWDGKSLCPVTASERYVYVRT